MITFVLTDRFNGNNGFEMIFAAVKGSEVHNGIDFPVSGKLTLIECRNRPFNKPAGYNLDGAGTFQTDFEPLFPPPTSIPYDLILEKRVPMDLEWLIHYAEKTGYLLKETGVKNYDSNGDFTGYTESTHYTPPELFQMTIQLVAGESEIKLNTSLADAVYVNGVKVATTYGTVVSDLPSEEDIVIQIVPNSSTSFSFNNTYRTLKSLSLDSVGTVKSLFSLALNQENLETFECPADTSEVTSWSNMVAGTKITSFPLIDTSSAKTMGGMLRNCTLLTEVPDLDTSNVTTFSAMLDGCTALTDFPNFDFSKVTDISSFCSSSGITAIPNISAPLVTNARYFCDGNTDLLTVGELDFPSCYQIDYMFQDCSSLVSVEKLLLGAVRQASYAFADCVALEYISEIQTSAYTGSAYSNMFPHCTSLVCIGGTIDTTGRTTYYNMFHDCTSLVAPDGTAQTTLLDGGTWTNPGVCPVV